jgi:Family of unknown function (DUF6644)
MMPPESWRGTFEWLEHTTIGTAVHQSPWLFPILESLHLVGLCLLGGAVVVGDLRAIGIGLTRRSLAEVMRQVRPWVLAGILVMVVTGVPLFLSEAVKCYNTPAFWVKIATLPFALTCTLGSRRWIVRSNPEAISWTTRAVGITSLALWFTVAAAGRWIGFSG